MSGREGGGGGRITGWREVHEREGGREGMEEDGDDSAECQKKREMIYLSSGVISSCDKERKRRSRKKKSRCILPHTPVPYVHKIFTHR